MDGMKFLERIRGWLAYCGILNAAEILFPNPLGVLKPSTLCILDTSFRDSLFSLRDLGLKKDTKRIESPENSPQRNRLVPSSKYYALSGPLWEASFASMSMSLHST